MVKANTYGVSVGERIYAHRPVYNSSDELYPTDKKIRPFVILGINGDELLVVSVTSNKKNRHNIEVAPWSYARINDLYLINTLDIVEIKEKIDDNVFNNLIYSIYFCIMSNDNVLYDNKVKEIFLKIYEKGIRKDIYQLLNRKPNSFQEREIIYVRNNNDKKYVIDKIVDEGYLAHRIVFNEEKLDIDFSSQVMLVNDEIYLSDGFVSLEEYNEKRDSYIKKKYAQNYSNHKEYNNSQNVYNSGDIIKYKGKKYFVIYKNSENKLVCIPYNGNYLLDHIKNIKYNDCVRCNIELSKEEIISILKKVAFNIQIFHNPMLQNRISVKIKEL